MNAGLHEKGIAVYIKNCSDKEVNRLITLNACYWQAFMDARP